MTLTHDKLIKYTVRSNIICAKFKHFALNILLKRDIILLEYTYNPKYGMLSLNCITFTEAKNNIALTRT